MSSQISQDVPETAAEVADDPRLKRRKCPQCQNVLPVMAFECLPYDVRCNRCVPLDQALAMRDRQLEGAQRNFLKLLDASGVKPSDNTKLDQLLGGIFSSWGGAHQFCEDLVESIQCRRDRNPGDHNAINAMLKILALKGRSDQLKSEDDWRRMSDEQIKESIKLQALEMFAELAISSGRPDLMGQLLEANGIEATPENLEEALAR